ncbi:hypothetical protein GCM10010145_44560 [Streptomyces ruber]|uniref:Uncharacterized protein n=1 Tax=Streptomyces ruber TaxID=83378 RepID=A0A918ETM7_9ACTN|nr:hypothetical protein GCM10010145_44560 [Streptomyces ruber]
MSVSGRRSVSATSPRKKSRARSRSRASRSAVSAAVPAAGAGAGATAAVGAVAEAAGAGTDAAGAGTGAGAVPRNAVAPSGRGWRIVPSLSATITCCPRSSAPSAATKAWRRPVSPRTRCQSAGARPGEPAMRGAGSSYRHQPSSRPKVR